MPVGPEEARAIALAYLAPEAQLARNPLAWGGEYAVIRVEDAGRSWRVFSNSRKFVKTGDDRYSLFGDGFLLISKETGDVSEETPRREAEGTYSIRLRDVLNDIGDG